MVSFSVNRLLVCESDNKVRLRSEITSNAAISAGKTIFLIVPPLCWEVSAAATLAEVWRERGPDLGQEMSPRLLPEPARSQCRA